MSKTGVSLSTLSSSGFVTRLACAVLVSYLLVEPFVTKARSARRLLVDVVWKRGSANISFTNGYLCESLAESSIECVDYLEDSISSMRMRGCAETACLMPSSDLSLFKAKQSNCELFLEELKELEDDCKSLDEEEFY